MNKNDFLIWEQASKDTIDFKKVYVDVAEDLIAGLLLSQIVYWNLPNKEGKTKLRVKIDGELWLAKGREDWWEEIRISAKQFDRASKILIEKGIIEKKLKKFDGLPTIHIKLNFDVLLKGIDKVLKPQPENEVAEEMAVSQDSVGFDQKSNWDLPNGENGICPKVKKGFDQRVNSITENTNKDYNKDYIHRKIREGEPSFPVLSDATKSDVISLEDKNDMKDKPTPAIIPDECINDLDKYFIGRLKKERAFYGINFDEEPYYNAFADALFKTQLQDSVEVLTMTQYPYFIKTLNNMIEPLETERKLLGW